jgi:phage FluMu gp28-like protein
MNEVLPRDPGQLPAELPRGADLPPDHDPLADGILMRHQVEWLDDDSDLKLGEKGRRTGITYAEALDDTLLAAKKRSAGGMNVFYIGDTRDKGREFIGYVAHFARIVAKELVEIEEFPFEDKKPDGESSFIAAYRVVFASGFRVEALSSRPENIRGLQGKVVIDEAAFHRDVREVIDAVNALLIWGGKIVVISTHNGVLNPFNELILEAKAGKVPYRLHFIPFSKAIENGLYRRVCLISGKEWTAEGEAAWERKIRAAYGVRTAAMAQELDCVPAEAEGAALTRVQIESCMQDGIPIVRWGVPDSFKNLPEDQRKAAALDFCERELKPVLDGFNPKLRHVFGSDFARKGDATVDLVFEIGHGLTRTCVLQLELRNVPFDQQRDVLFYLVDRLPRMGGGMLDASGNGAYIAEAAALRYGACVIEVKLSQEWYRLNAPPYVEAFADRTVVLARHDDVLRDHQALAYVGGVIKVPDDHRFKGSDGFARHGDSAIAGMLAYAASRADYWEAGYRSPATGARGGGPDDADDGARRDWWRSPLGAGLRGSI